MPLPSLAPRPQHGGLVHAAWLASTVLAATEGALMLNCLPDWGAPALYAGSSGDFTLRLKVVIAGSSKSMCAMRLKGMKTC